MRIYKYPLELNDAQMVLLPPNYKILHVGEQNRQLTMWAAVEPSPEIVEVMIEIIGTGNDYNPEGKTFLGTVIQGEFVWHIFKVED